MKGLLNGEIIEYSALTYEQLSNPSLTIIHEVAEDLRNPPKLHPETAKRLNQGFDWLVAWSEYYSKPFLWRLFHKPPKNIL
jgi:hypothetical protein